MKFESNKKSGDAGAKASHFHKSPVRGAGGASCAKFESNKEISGASCAQDESGFLSKIKSPQDIKCFSDEQLTDLCSEIRQTLIKTVSQNGGHLSPNLGVVELTVMLHSVFDSPKDSIVWDVGHQAYTHKILTGRYDRIDTIRTKNGLSGFPKRNESVHDAFNVGHSSTAISAAYGIARGKQLIGDNGYTIAVIGDGSATGGLAYEGLNNAGQFKKNFIVILNDNKMSISKNVGAIARYLSGIRIKPGYLKFKQKLERFLLRIPKIGSHILKYLVNSKLRFKSMVYRNVLFEFLGFSYYGPVDGHNFRELRNALNAAKKIKTPVLIHVVTTKGKGYKFAENNPKEFHGIGCFDVNSGEVIAGKKTFSAHFGNIICKMAEENPKLCAITAAMKLGTGLQEFSEKFRARFFDVGIAESHAVTFSCGLAVKGLIPVFAVYSTFLQRSFDQLIHDAASQDLRIILAIDRAGIVGEDGETHQGVFDAAMLNTIPGAVVFSPAYFDGLEKSFSKAVNQLKTLTAVRYPRGGPLYRPVSYVSESENFDIYGDKKAKKLIVVYGKLFSFAAETAEELSESGEKVCVLKLCRIKPIDQDALNFAVSFNSVYFFEEGILSGGIGETFGSMLLRQSYSGKYIITAIDNRFVVQASIGESLMSLNLDKNGMVRVVSGK